MGKIIAVANQKGGVGKTTTAINFSASLAVAEKRTLLVDIDPQGNASIGVGFYGVRIDDTLYRVITGGRRIGEVIKKTELDFLHAIPSTIDLAGAEVELIPQIAREMKLKDALSEVASLYDYIVIDCPPSLGLLTINALTAADSVLIPLQCEFFALGGLSQLKNTISLIKKSLNPSLTIEGVLLTMFDGRMNLTHQVSSEVKQHFGSSVFNTIIPRNVRLSEAPSHGKPALLYDIKSRGAEAYLCLAKEFLSNN